MLTHLPRSPLLLFQNEAATAKEFVKIMEAAENDYQVGLST